MILGYFRDQGSVLRPFVDLTLRFPVANNQPLRISFLVDTGADRTLLSPTEGARLRERLGVDILDLPFGSPIVGVGGQTETRMIDATLDIGGQPISTTLSLVEGPRRRAMVFPTNAAPYLGRDIIYQLALFMDLPQNRQTAIYWTNRKLNTSSRELPIPPPSAKFIAREGDTAMQKTNQTNLERFHADALWFSDHYKELRSLYPDQWVCVYNKEVAGANEDPELLITEMQSKNVPVAHAYFKFHCHSKDEVNWAYTGYRMIRRILSRRKLDPTSLTLILDSGISNRQQPGAGNSLSWLTLGADRTLLSPFDGTALASAVGD